MEQYEDLISEARRAIGKCFLANPNTIRRYGAAVKTQKGIIYSAGQYSSFNHITSIHAEMAAVVLATMSDDSEIIACAVATKDNVSNAKSCGICLQFLKEHAERTGNDIDMIYIGKDDIKIYKLSDLVKDLW